jgi:hypothetical protein
MWLTIKVTFKCHFVLGLPNLGVLTLSKLGLSQLWRFTSFCAGFWLRWDLKQSYNSCWELSKNIWHATYTQVNQGDSRLLMVGSQIDTLTSGPSFNHNLCFKNSNGTWVPILDIYILGVFQWYKLFFNLMNFDLCNLSLKIRESIRIPTPKVGDHLGVCEFIPSHLLTLSRAWNVTFGLHFRPAPLQALALVVSPKLKSWQLNFFFGVKWHLLGSTL